MVPQPSRCPLDQYPVYLLPAWYFISPQPSGNTTSCPTNRDTKLICFVSLVTSPTYLRNILVWFKYYFHLQSTCHHWENKCEQSFERTLEDLHKSDSLPWKMIVNVGNTKIFSFTFSASTSSNPLILWISFSACSLRSSVGWLMLLLLLLLLMNPTTIIDTRTILNNNSDNNTNLKTGLPTIKFLTAAKNIVNCRVMFAEHWLSKLKYFQTFLNETLCQQKLYIHWICSDIVRQLEVMCSKIAVTMRSHVYDHIMTNSF